MGLTICGNLFHLLRSFQKRLHHSYKNEKWLDQQQSNLRKEVLHCKQPFLLFWCISSTTTPGISSSSKNINSTILVSYDYALIEEF